MTGEHERVMDMRRFCRAWIVVVITILSLQQAGANLLVNGSFENVTAGQPDGWWKIENDNSGAWLWENNSNARSGTNLVAIGFWSTGGNAYWGQTVTAVSQGQEFDFSVYTKTEPGFDGTIYLKTEFKDDLGNFLWTNQSAGVSGENTTFTQLLIHTDPAPAGTTQANFLIYVEGTVNSAMFDDANVDPVAVPEPAAIGMFGAGLLALIRFRRRR